MPGLTLPHATRQRWSGLAVNVPLQAIDAGFAEAIAASDVLYDHRYASIFAELRDEVKILETRGLRSDPAAPISKVIRKQTGW